MTSEESQRIRIVCLAPKLTPLGDALMSGLEDSRPASGPMKILLVEDDPGDVRLFHEMLRETPSFRFTLKATERLSDALRHLGEHTFDIILLDLNLPDSRGFESFHRVHAQEPMVPIVVLSGLDDEELALRAVQEGAQDYLCKQSVTGPLLVKSMRYAVERQRLHRELEEKGREIREMTQHLWQSAKLATMGELAASIAHELNNPLATVSLRVESLLAEVDEEDPRRELLEVVDQEVERMSELVSNLLEFSRRSSRQISSVDICQEISATLELVYHHLRNRGITVVKEFAAGVPMICVDRHQLRQVFMNLFTNASDAMPQGGTLTLRAAETREFVVIEVADTGVGIAPENLPKVVDAFFSTKPEGKGTGLGLSICRRIVDEHGGTLQVASEVDQGTTIRIELPKPGTVDGLVLEEE